MGGVDLTKVFNEKQFGYACPVDKDMYERIKNKSIEIYTVDGRHLFEVRNTDGTLDSYVFYVIFRF
jgi:hypothetical protein